MRTDLQTIDDAPAFEERCEFLEGSSENAKGGVDKHQRFVDPNARSTISFENNEARFSFVDPAWRGYESAQFETRHEAIGDQLRHTEEEEERGDGGRRMR